MTRAERTIRGLLELADVELNGGPDFDLPVNDPVFYRRVLSGGAVGFSARPTCSACGTVRGSTS